MSLWIDRYRPKALDKLDFHADVSRQLQQLASCGDVPHILMFGPSGAGKKTRVVALLREIFGSGVEKLKIDQKTFQTPSGTNLELSVISSNYHIEISPSDVGNNDRIVIQEVLKEIAQTQQIDASASRNFKVVVVHEADSLSREAQAGLRRTMEKYVNNLRMILIAQNSSKIIAPVRSRCLLVRVPAPSVDEICLCLQAVAKKQGFALPEEFAKRIALASDQNLRKALLMLEAAKIQKFPFSPNQEVQLPDWQRFICDVASLILEEQTPQRLLIVREKLYEVLVHCIPPTVLFRTLTLELVKNLDGEIKSEVVFEAAHYEHQMQSGSKPIFHLEAFVAKFMSVYKKFLMDISMM